MMSLLLAIVVSASIDSTILMLGDQTDLHLRVTQDANEQVEMPVFGMEVNRSGMYMRLILHYSD